MNAAPTRARIAAGVLWAMASPSCDTTAGTATGEAPSDVATAAPARPPVSVKASVDRAVATTGDLIRYAVEVQHDPAVEVTIPELGAAIAGFRIVDVGTEAPVTVDGRVRQTRWYKLRADLVGSYVLPPVRVSYRPVDGSRPNAGDTAAVAADSDVMAGAASGDDADARRARDGAAVAAAGDGDGAIAAGSADDERDDDATQEPGPGESAEEASQAVTASAVFVEVKSVLPADGEATDIHDIKPLRPVASRTPWLWIGALAASLVILAVGGWWVMRRRRREVWLPPVPPHEVAFAALDTLRQTDFADRSAVRSYYFEISEILRAYVEARYGLNATDLTTDEILGRFAELKEVPREQRHALRTFLADTDHVKFAEYSPSEPEIQSTYERALGFVEATAASAAPSTAAPEGAAEAATTAGAPPA